MSRRRMHSPADDINILLLGQTGVGKSTFINAFVNYLIYDDLDSAMKGPMQVLVPASFSITDPDTFEMTNISIGEVNDREKQGDIGESCTQECQSFVFSIGDRNLRLIDAPGIGDTRGIERDATNFEDILAYISQYEHLNGICILFKPNEERLSIFFRFCIKELLRHLHINARENLLFVFTNVRSSFYKPGLTSVLLKNLLKELNESTGINVPFSKENTFLFDNESFRFLVAHKNDIPFSLEQIQEYRESWNVSVSQLSCFISYILTRPLHALRDTLSLNEAQQLIRKLTRPIAETTTLIEENIQLAKAHQDDVLKNRTDKPESLLQKDAEFVPLPHPRTVCISEKCIRVIIVDGEQKIDYASHCHPHCYLRGVEQEVLHNPKLQYCKAMDKNTGECRTCGCHWNRHMHITYEYRKSLTYINMQASNKEHSPLKAIEQRIADLRDEESCILNVYTQLSQFLHTNTITPINDDLLDYIRHFICEEQQKQDAGAENADIITGLENMMAQYEHEMDLFKRTLNNSKTSAASADHRNQIHTEDIFTLVGTLYRLPINGQKIREQVEGLKRSQLMISRDREQFFKLPSVATSSKTMLQLHEVLNSKRYDRSS